MDVEIFGVLLATNPDTSKEDAGEERYDLKRVSEEVCLLLKKEPKIGDRRKQAAPPAPKASIDLMQPFTS